MKLSSLVNPLSYYMFFRKRSLLRRLKSVGKNFVFDPLSSIMTPELIDIGDNVFIGERAHISSVLRIGNNVMFGPRPVLIGGDHLFGVRGESIRFLHPVANENSEPIVIEDEAWFGASVVILGSVTAGMGCVIGAGSVLSRSIPPFTIAVGNPCRPIKRIFDDQGLLEHLSKLGYDRNYCDNIISRRNAELRGFAANDLPVIDRTESYRKLRS